MKKIFTTLSNKFTKLFATPEVGVVIPVEEKVEVLPAKKVAAKKTVAKKTVAKKPVAKKDNKTK